MKIQISLMRLSKMYRIEEDTSQGKKAMKFWLVFDIFVSNFLNHLFLIT